MQEYRKILVPVDGSKEAEWALKKATQVAIRNHATIDVLNVLDTRQFVGAYGRFRELFKRYKRSNVGYRFGGRAN